MTDLENLTKNFLFHIHLFFLSKLQRRPYVVYLLIVLLRHPEDTQLTCEWLLLTVSLSLSISISSTVLQLQIGNNHFRLPEKPEHSPRDSWRVLGCSDFCCKVVWYSDFHYVKRIPLAWLKCKSETHKKTYFLLFGNFLPAGRHLATKFSMCAKKYW